MSRRKKAFILLITALVVIPAIALFYIYPPGELLFGKREFIEIQPLAPVEPEDVEMVKKIVEKYFGFEVRVLAVHPIPDFAHISNKKQYDARAVLDWLFERRSPAATRIIAVTSADLAYQSSEFNFGLATVWERTAVISTCRLDRPSTVEGAPSTMSDEWDDFYKLRLEKVVCHELGHTFELRHCEKGCLMFCSLNLADLDRSTVKFCPKCLHTLSWTLEKTPETPEARADLGCVYYFRKKNPERALAEWNAALADDPDCVRALYGTAMYRLDRGLGASNNADVSGALKIFKRIVEDLKPDHAESWQKLGTIYYLSGKYMLARDCFNRALEYNPEDLFACRHLGILHEKYFEVDGAKALKYYRQYFAMGGSDESARESLRRLEMLETTPDSDVKTPKD
jgi:archaemetzincin